mmetsp:Transcript_8458/g.20763  ORF Transcript_8458/g.20763 Transcript_8458/m.20763 type:complete len:96 (-) Transcript_8458:39-326(-)
MTTNPSFLLVVTHFPTSCKNLSHPLIQRRANHRDGAFLWRNRARLEDQHSKIHQSLDSISSNEGTITVSSGMISNERLGPTESTVSSEPGVNSKS